MADLRPMRMTAAVPSKRLLAVATLSWNGSHLFLVPTFTTFFSMPQDDQFHVRQVASQIWTYFSNRRVAGILVRRGPRAGPRQASPGSTKLETILQLMPFTSGHVLVQKATGWGRQRDWLLPLTQRGLSPKEAELQAAAIKQRRLELQVF